MTTKLIYLASPYSHEDHVVECLRFQAACSAAGRLMREGHFIFSPIAHSHPIAIVESLPGGIEYWREYDRRWIDACDELWVLCIDGWEESKGVTWEIDYALSTEKSVRYLDPETLEIP